METDEPELTCNICEINYNLTEHLPYKICQNGHTVCKWCLKQIRKKSSCPYCRSSVSRDSRKLDERVLSILDSTYMKSSSAEIKTQYRNDQITETANNLASRAQIEAENGNNQSIRRRRMKICCFKKENCFKILLYYFILLQVALSIETMIMGFPQLGYHSNANHEQLSTKVLAWSVITIGIVELLTAIVTFIGFFCFSRGNIDKESFRIKKKIWSGFLIILNALQFSEMTLIFFTRNQALSDIFFTFMIVLLPLFATLKGIKIGMLCCAPKMIR